MTHDLTPKDETTLVQHHKILQKMGEFTFVRQPERRLRHEHQGQVAMSGKLSVMRTMRRVTPAIIGSMATFAAGNAVAEDQDLAVSANVTITSNYIYRGITQTDNGPAIQGGFDVSYGLFYAGTWASSVDFGDDTTMEIDFYGGIAPSIGETNFDFGVLYYAYPDSPELPTGTQNFVEFYAGVNRAFGPVEPSVKVSYSPDFYGETGGAFYLQGDVAFQLTDQLTASAGVGASMFENDLLNDDYIDFNAGGTFSQWGFDFDLRYHGTGNRVGGSDDGTVVFAVSRSF